MSRNTQALLVVLAAAVLAVGSDRLRTAAHGAYAAGQAYEDIYYLPPTAWLPVFSLGWDEALADVIWMRALVYFGQEFEHAGHIRFVFDYGEAMEALDPDFIAVYRWVGMAGLYRPQAITPADIERAVTFMQRGARRFPNDGDLAWDIGAALVFELAPILDDPEAKDHARRRGTPYLMRASRLGAAPEWAVLTNVGMLERIGQREQAARHLEEMLPTVRDLATRSRMEAALRRMQDRTRAEAFIAAEHELEERRRQTFPYVHPDLFPQLGQRPPVDLDAPIREGMPAALAVPDP